MDQIKTHQKIDPLLCGKPLDIREDYSRVELSVTSNMIVDNYQLAHGGFVFGLADHAAMIAVNHPHVVLGSAEVKFLKPVKTGDSVVAEAKVIEKKGRKRIVEVEIKRGEEIVFDGRFICFVLDKHVLE